MTNKPAFEALLNEARRIAEQHWRSAADKDAAFAAALAAYEAATQSAPFKPTGNPELDAVLLKPDPTFDAFVASLPANYWARYDLSAVRLGWHYGRAVATVHINELDDALQAAADERDAAGREGQLGALIHYPEHWDIAAYPTLDDALQEIGCSQCTHSAPKADAEPAMCPNCVTPWKCNGPHVPAKADVAADWVERLFNAIKHGDADHQAWLRNAMQVFARDNSLTASPAPKADK